MMSLTMTRAQGSRNQIRPSNRLLTKKEEGMKTTCGVVRCGVGYGMGVVRCGSVSEQVTGTQARRHKGMVQAGPRGMCPHEHARGSAEPTAGGAHTAPHTPSARPPHQQDHVSPGVLPELVRVPPLLQRQHKAAAAAAGGGTQLSVLLAARALPPAPLTHHASSPNSCARASVPHPHHPPYPPSPPFCLPTHPT